MEIGDCRRESVQASLELEIRGGGAPYGAVA